MFSAKQAFSLVELSIVLVILGLLAGGVLSGQALIRASEMRSITSDVNNIKAVTLGFHDKYFGLPGDLKNATQFWGTQLPAIGITTGKDDACYTIESTSKATCNGNGDNLIHKGYSATTHAERGRYWQHLANAGLIEGQYTGYHGPISNETRRGGFNAMRSKVGGAHWNVGYIAPAAHDGRMYDTLTGNMAELTRDFSGSEASIRDLLTPAEQWNIDTKIDDGKPATGILRGPKRGWVTAPDCTTSTDATLATYDLQLDRKACFPTIFLNQ